LVFPEILGGIKVQMTFVKLMLIGLLITLSLKYNPKGLLPEVPYRPTRPLATKGDHGSHEIAAILDYDEHSQEVEIEQDEEIGQDE